MLVVRARPAWPAPARAAGKEAALTHPPPPFDPWLWLQAWNETWTAGLSPAAARWLRDQRLAALIACARRDSPLYRRRAADAQRLADFEPVEKAFLMRHFDDWATDRRITRAAVAPFIADAGCIADACLGDYLVWTSSGTSGLPGWFVQDARSLAAYDAIDALRLRGAVSVQASLGLWGAGQRFAYIGASGGHFAGLVTMMRLQRIAPPGLAPALTLLSVQQPLRRIASALQALQPTVLITYPSCAAALAQLQHQGALQLALREVWVGGEQLSAEQRHQVIEAFGCLVRNNYGASECFSIAWECAHGSLHVNDDWVILEPVDAQLRPVPVGEVSHTTLLTNLANRVQPLLRYRLDDRVRVLPARCACGSAFTAIEVQGRSGDTLVLHDAHRRAVPVLPLALETAIEEEAHVTQFQVIGHADGSLELRFEPAVADAQAAFARCRQAIRALLSQHGVSVRRITFSAAAPVRERASGKLRRVVVAPRGD
jgi:phenylacetate-coenzyme A ligase PaaK-like adenylate-forming protein